MAAVGKTPASKEKETGAREQEEEKKSLMTKFQSDGPSSDDGKKLKACMWSLNLGQQRLAP